ncbi:hypothetical protein [Mangrovimonas aestuarii]|uniref:hypothetical protein n=1 Tax=Mangrovimonas aestuarii TaxID=3018443 RepID=UPI002378B82F|nr:hypothetical protein [Mangrovimonas aestuarii]
MRSKKLLIRLLIGLIIVAFAFFQKWSRRETNPYTGRAQTINMISDQEISIGL